MPYVEYKQKDDSRKATRAVSLVSDSLPYHLCLYRVKPQSSIKISLRDHTQLIILGNGLTQFRMASTSAKAHAPKPFFDISFMRRFV